MRNSVLVLAGAVVLAAGGVTYGATRAADQTINACVEPANGQMFLMTATVCPPGQQTLSWNKEGPQGPPGVQGVQGIQGPASSAPSGPASASDAVVGIVVAKYRRVFATSIDVSGVGTHLVTGHVHVAVDPSMWKRDGHINCQLVGDSTLDSSSMPIVHGGAAQKFDVDLDGLVTIEPVPSSNTAESTLPTNKTVYFKCQTISPKTSTKFTATFTFVRMTDELLKSTVIHLPIKVAVKKFGR